MTETSEAEYDSLFYFLNCLICSVITGIAVLAVHWYFFKTKQREQPTFNDQNDRQTDQRQSSHTNTTKEMEMSMAYSGQDQSAANSTRNDEGRQCSDISDNVVQELNEADKKHGIPDVIVKVKKSLNERTEALDIAVIGESGVGKSSFINAFCGMTVDDVGAAPVDVIDPINSINPYTHPQIKSLTLWDIPGVGSPRFPMDSWLQKVNFERYEFFLILSVGRFTRTDGWLAQQIRQAGKCFYFIKTNIDSIIMNDKRAHPKTHSMARCMHQVRSDCIKQLQHEGFANPEVFLISNYCVNEFDFGLLTEHLIRDAPNIKQEAVTLSLTEKLASSGQYQSAADSTGNDQRRQFSNIPDKVVQEINEAYKKHGIPGITEKVKKSLNEWKKVPLNIAIIGNSGVGKSSFINALRCMTGDDEGAAPVGVVETTSVPTSYPHPENESLTLWDLPGVGTPNFPPGSYLQKIEFEKYEFFLILTAKRFTTNDVWLAQQIRQAGKRFYFIRTQIDSDISDDQKTHPRTYSRDKVLHRARSDCIKQLQDQDFANPQVFLISNFDVNEFDFGHLTERLIRDVPNIKREALTLSLTVLTEEIIRAKEKYLKKRIYIVSVASAAAAAVPIPGVGLSVDIAILLEEAVFYRKQLRLDEMSVQENAAALNISVSELQQGLNLQSQIISYTARGLLSFFGSLGISDISENVLKVALPLIGCLISAGISYRVQVFCLNKLLDTMVNDALRINAKMNTVVAWNTMDEFQRIQT